MTVPATSPLGTILAYTEYPPLVPKSTPLPALIKERLDKNKDLCFIAS